MPPSVAHLPEWGTASVVVTACLALTAVLYLLAWRAASRAMPERLPGWRAGSFLAGLFLLWCAWSPQLIALTHILLTAHMVQHLLSNVFSPPLLLLGEPLRVFGWKRSRGEHSSQAEATPGWASSAGLSIAQRLTHPVTAGSIMVAVTIFWHVPAVFHLSMSSPGLCALENATFWISGMLFWWPVVLPWPGRRRWPRWAIPLYLLGSDMPVSVLSAYLAFCGHVVYPMYLHSPNHLGVSPLDDQVGAAMLMWVVMMLVYIGAAAVNLVKWLEPAAFRNPSAASG